MVFRRNIADGIDVRSTEAKHAGALEVLQKLVFPTLSAEELFRAEHYRKHLELFPEGQFVGVVDGGCSGEAVVGMTSTLRLGDDCLQPHTFAQVIAGGFLTTHEPDGRWMYGVDVGVHPNWRRRGIARALYAARHDAARRLGLAGQVTVGMLSGYGAVREQMSAEAYYDELIAGKRTDPTISAQKKLGFEPRGLVAEYVMDPVCDGYGVLLVLPIETDVRWPR